MIAILLGAPGSGKGTQSKALASKYGFRHLSTGDIFRAEIAEKTPLGEKAAEYVKKGQLVPDEVVTEMVAAKLEPGQKYLLDGFPRNLAQAQSLDTMIKGHKMAVEVVILLDLPQAEAIKRLTSRRVCKGCGEVYNVLTKAPKTEGKCDLCGADVIQRDDDSETTAKKRLMVFDDLTSPLTTYYKAEGVFHSVDASQSPDQVTRQLSAVIDSAAGAVK